MPHRFYWLIEGSLAGCSRPGAWGSNIDRDLAELKTNGIGAILSLTEQPLDRAALARHGIDALHIPVDDFHAPTTSQMLSALSFIDEAIAANQAVAVHCLAGQGRTGAILAAYLLRGGQSATDVIETLRAICPGAIESPPQVQALHDWAIERPWMI
jgi:atypical dual specificity phosphatase